MKKIILIFLTAFVVSAFVFADTAAENYLSHFESLVTDIEASAKKKDASKISAYETQKQSIDEERTKVTLSIKQRFTDWRYTSRYDTAHTELVVESKKESASEKIDEAKGTAKEKAGEVKESAGKKSDEIKTEANKKVDELEQSTKEKIDDAVDAKKDQISEKISEKAEDIGRAAKEKAEKVKEAADEKEKSANSKIGGFFDKLFGKGDKEESK